MRILQSRSFERYVRRFNKRQKAVLDTEIRKISGNPEIGQQKKGDLKGVYVHKFKVQGAQYLVAYRFSPETLELVMIGSHENYYRDLKAYLKSR